MTEFSEYSQVNFKQLLLNYYQADNFMSNSATVCKHQITKTSPVMSFQLLFGPFKSRFTLLLPNS